MKTLIIVILLAHYASSAGTGSSWGYSGAHGPEHWDGVCHYGQEQSPIDFAAPVYKDFGDFHFNNYHKDPWKITLVNNGHTLKTVFHTKALDVPKIKGGGLNDTYEFAQAHFHWGGSSVRGSEHLVDGKAFPMEMHLVHFNTKYESLALAAARPDGLAVLGIFFQLSKTRNPIFDHLFSGLSDISEPGTETDLETTIALKNLIPEKTSDFFRYKGSLTTPPCAESVTWTVFLEPLEIAESQIYDLRRLRSSDHRYMINNFRPVSYLNDRTSYVSMYNFSISQLKPKETIPSYRYDVYDDKPDDVDHFFLLIMSIIIFFMQCGFAFMEAGAVRSKNTVNILIKNWLDMCLGALVYWAIGFGLTFGESTPALKRIVGTSYFFFIDMPPYKLSKWFFQFVFAATAATLVSGSLAERCNFIAYIVYSVMITGFIYPVIAHWTWHREGWLRIYGYHDFAGSGVVHLTGALCALVGCVLMGPRIGRFDKDGKPVPMPGHSVPLSALGGLILVFGFFACNGTKQGSISHPGDGIAIATAIVNTALGTSAAGLCTLIFNKTGIVPGTGGNYSFLVTMNGSLTGTVALCAGCNVFPTWGAVIVGALSGPLFLYFNYLLVRLKIDDPLDAIPVHGVGGVWGTLSVYIFKKDGILMTFSEEAFIGLGWNVVGLVTITIWTGVTCFVMFFLLKKLNMLRVETEHEFKGMDLLKHGESAYPADAWVEQQYMKDGGMADEQGIDSNGVNKPDTDQSRDGLPPNMNFSRAASYNNPHEMFPSASKLFSGMNMVAGNVAKSENKLGATAKTTNKAGKITRKPSVPGIEEEKEQRRTSLSRLTEESAHVMGSSVGRSISPAEMNRKRNEKGTPGTKEEMALLRKAGKL